MLSTTVVFAALCGEKPSAGCGKPQPEINGLVIRKFQQRQDTKGLTPVERTYAIALPTNYNGKSPSPALTYLHGQGADFPPDKDTTYGEMPK